MRGACALRGKAHLRRGSLGRVLPRFSLPVIPVTRGESLVKLSNSQGIAFGVISSRTLSHPVPTCFQLGVRESGHTLFHNSASSYSSFFFIFSKPAISLTEAD